jgi:hypothetical protein
MIALVIFIFFVVVFFFGSLCFSQAELIGTINSMGGAQLVDTVDSDTTHVVTSVVDGSDLRTKRTFKYMHGMCLGKWIVSQECTRVGERLREIERD